MTPTGPALADVITKFNEFDLLYFAGKLRTGTAVERFTPPDGVDANDAPFGFTKKDGTQILINLAASAAEYEWECTLLHEMVHAFEYRFPGEITVTDEGRRMEESVGRNPVYEYHSAKFFTKLAEIMRARDHEPRDHFHRYFG